MGVLWLHIEHCPLEAYILERDSNKRMVTEIKEACWERVGIPIL